MSPRTILPTALAVVVGIAWNPPTVVSEGMGSTSNICIVNKNKKIKRLNTEHVDLLQVGPDTAVFYHAELLGGQPTKPIDIAYDVDINCFARDAGSVGGFLEANGTVQIGTANPRGVNPLEIPCTGRCDCIFDTQTRGATKGKWKKAVACPEAGDALLDLGWDSIDVSDCNPPLTPCFAHTECCSNECEPLRGLDNSSICL